MPAASWERSRPIKRSNKSSIFPDDGQRKPQLFVASFERKTERPQMSLLLGWEYGREWLRERNEFLRHDTFQAKQRFIAPDFNWWLKKRAVVIDRRKLFKRHRQGATKSYEMTAFDATRQLRRERQTQQQNPQSAQNHNNQCKCADCKQKKYNPCQSPANG